LATALNDLAGVLHLRRDLAGASPLYAEAETLFASLAQADPENADTRFMLIHAQYDYARLQRDFSRFSEAASAYRRAIDSLSRFPVERLSTDRTTDFMRIEILQRDLSDCESAPLALGTLAPLQSRPPHDACPLLLARARLLSALDRPADALDAMEAVCSVGADTADAFAAVTSALGECARILDDMRCTGTLEARRSKTRRRCTDRTVSILTRAVAHGFADGSHFEHDTSLNWLHGDPAFRALVDRLKTPQPAPTTSTVPGAATRD
jgi:tetratricopeptide (TPR) repeat protein